jgi:hypothetical protein
MAFIQSTRRKKIYRVVAAYLALNMIAEYTFPIAAHALTNGPSQPEVQSFEPVGTSDMVDLFTGDFNYNIPLFELPGPNGGYPFNIAYHSGIGMDQEASWVGLGWNLNPGAVVRDMRGLPDDFNGQTITRRLDMEDNISFGLGYAWNYEVFGADGDKVASQVNFPTMFSLYYNNYKGIGYSISPSFRVGANPGEEGAALGLSLNIDSQEGVGVSASVSFAREYKKRALDFSLGGTFSSRSGLSMSTAMGVGEIVKRESAFRKLIYGAEDQYGIAMSGSSGYAFAQQAYSPVTSTSTSGFGISFSFKFGAGPPGIFTNNTMKGFFNTQYVNQKNEEINVLAYGYNHLGMAEWDYALPGEASTSLYDVNRENDGILNKATPNLAMPNLTYDIYNVQGQGTGGSFRAYSSEIGRMFDPPCTSVGVSVSLGLEAAATPTHFGVDVELGLRTSHTEPWDGDNEWDSRYKFRRTLEWDDNYAEGSVAPEPHYYKSLGEHTSFAPSEMDYIGGEAAVRGVLEKGGTVVSRKYIPQQEELQKSNGEVINVASLASSRNYRERLSRNTTIEPVTNDLLLDENGTEILKEYDIAYYNTVPSSGYYPQNPNVSITRATIGTTDISSHVAGITAFNPDGNRYVYGLPVYNLSHHEIAYSAPVQSFVNNLPSTDFLTPCNGSEPDYTISGTEEYYSETNLGPYVHSHLLTGILGTDYIDVTGDGITEDDHGYWVKFNYVRTNPYEWRAPFGDAMYEPGLFSTARDDKGYIEYGEKEIYYLATAETKTHIAVFKVSSRSDGKEANGKFSPGNAGTEAYYKLDAIEVYAKSDYAKLVDVSNTNDDEARAIKVVNFSYNYSLCPATQNSVATGQGKLTLTGISFEYQNNSRGTLSPYTFSYSSGGGNPAYDVGKYDRWSNYKSDGTAFERKYLPYVSQFNDANTQTNAERAVFQAIKDQDASVWNLTQITLPTGGKINISYEADDYAHVQHRTATQMFKISRFYDAANPETIYDDDDWTSADIRKRRVYFKLEKPIPVGAGAVRDFFDQYIAGLRQDDGSYQMYYKLLMNVRQNSETPKEFISGYSNLLVTVGGVDNQVLPDTAEYGFRNFQVTIDGVPCYTDGFVTVDLTHVDGANTDKYHPFAVAGWQHLRTTQPDLVHTVGGVTNSNPSNADKVVAAKSLLSFIADIEQLFKGFRDYCFHQDYAETVPELDYCVIRLCTPDMKKIGGGCRVKQLSITDEWNAQSGEASSTYGQVYEYTTTNEAGATISSGVAAYEPQIGGDEIALRYAKHYPEEIPIFTDNDLFFEYPLNEANYPAPVVGYSKVTVKSLTSDAIIDNTLTELVRGTGAVVTEFYTAKDFPVITDETAIDKRPFDLFIPIPFIGQIRTNNYTATQGYAITLNDMHGKLKAVTNYGLDSNGDLLEKPESSVEYQYDVDNLQMPDGTAAMKLDNTVNVIYGDDVTGTGMYETDIQEAIVGVEYDFFTDQRKNRAFNASMGIDFNVEVAGIVGFPFPWPSFSCNTNDVRTAVTNKIIHKSGILTKVIATDAQSEVTTENKVFDAQTGRPLLVTVTNNFEDPIYRYDIPAHWEYENMGAAYKNIDFTFVANIDVATSAWSSFTIDASPITWNTSTVTLSFDEVYDILAEGDEFILSYDNDNDGSFESSETQGRATLIERREYCNTSGPSTRSLLFHTPESVSANHKVMLRVVRSGRRNLLGVNAGSIVALADPTIDANRGTENPTGVSYNNAAFAPEIAEFLNYIIDCDGQLVYKTYDLTSSIFYGGDGDHLFPLLGSIFSSIAVEQCAVDQIRLVFTYIDAAGTCSKTTCGCYTLGHLPGQTAIADIASFTYSTGSTILVNYESGGVVGGGSIVLECLSVNATPVVTYTTDVINASAVTFRDYWDYDASATACQSSSAAANLYAIGKKGIWRPWKDYYYSDERYKNTGHTAGTQLATDGVFDGNGSDKHYYFFRWNANIFTPVPSQWIPNNTITRFDKDGNELENRNIIGNYSCAKFGYNNTLAIAVAANARYFEVYYQSVDDNSNTVVMTGGSGFNGPSSLRAHTGTTSLFINDGQGNDELDLSDHLFEPSKEYVVSMWVARATPQYTYKETSSANSAACQVICTDLAGTTTLSTSALFEPTGEVIEGWQRIEAKFTTPAAATGESYVKMKIDFQSGSVASSTVTSWFDDIRVFPANGNMVSYVYDPVTFRLTAKLDDNNYATFYHYDEEGSLFLVKQETARGIATVQEARSHKQH